jgi:hypothetical protein
VVRIEWLARRIGAGFGAGLLAGAATGLGARLLMFAIRRANAAFDGATTHGDFVNGQWTLEGTLNLVLQGTFVGGVGGLLYLALRPLLRGPSVLRGLELGAITLFWMGSLVLDGSYEYSRYVSTWIAVAAFASLYPFFGVLVAVLADRFVRPSPPHQAIASAIGSALLALVTLVAAARFAAGLRFVYFP